MLKNKNNKKITIDIDDNVIVNQNSQEEQIQDVDLSEEALAASNFNNQINKPTNSQKEVWLKPISKKRFVVKLIPFMILVTLVVGLALFFVIFAAITPQEKLQVAKINFYLFMPILFVVASPFAFYLFDRAYCQYNLKHNEKMKQKIGKLFVKNVSQNGCFRLKDIYLSNPNQLCWLNNQAVIIENYKRWDPAAYEEDIKYYREHKM